MAQAPSGAAPPASPTIVPIAIPNLPLGLVTFPSGKALNLTVGLGSALFRHPADQPGRIWMVTDRGAAIECSEARRITGQEPAAACPGSGPAGRISPLPGFAPSIYAADIGPDSTARITVYLPLKGRSGKPVSGRPPAIAGRFETGFSSDGKALPPDPSGIDPEGIIRLADGSFWVAEEFGPSLLKVAADGTILRRLVPAGSAAEFRDADYEVIANLPAILRNRVAGRGFEGLALSADEQRLHVVMQSALAQPDADTARLSRNVRLLTLDLASGEVQREDAYELDEPASDAPGGSPSGIRELVALPDGALLSIERTARSTRIYRFRPNDDSRIPSLLGLPDYRPTFEQMTREQLRPRGIVPMAKTLVFDSEQSPGLPARIEGMAVLSPHEILLINDNDFATEGVRTQLFRVTLPDPLH